jgi:hypothetical protein
MPLPVVEEDIARGILIPISVEGLPPARSAPVSEFIVQTPHPAAPAAG